MNSDHPYLVASWSDDDLAPLREWRRAKAQIDQSPEAGRDEKRDAQRYVKAATLVLSAIEGSGPCRGGIPRGFFPAELGHHLRTATAYIGRQL